VAQEGFVCKPEQDKDSSGCDDRTKITTLVQEQKARETEAYAILDAYDGTSLRNQRTSQARTNRFIHVFICPYHPLNWWNHEGLGLDVCSGSTGDCRRILHLPSHDHAAELWR
jgi:hypothetical protein